MKTTDTLQTQSVHFRIDPEWLTDLLRTLWIEREYGKAFKIADAAFPQMQIEDKLYLVTGRKKLVYADCADAEDNSIFNLEGDDWKPSGALKGMTVPTFIDVLEQSQLFSDNERPLELLREISVLAHASNGIPTNRQYGMTRSYGTPKGMIRPSHVIELICRVFPPPSNEQWEAFWEKYGEEVEEIKEGEGRDFGFIRDSFKNIEQEVDKQDANLAAQWGPATANNIDIFMAHDRELSKRLTPLPDTKLEADDGWLLPTGKLYPCGYMEHIWLAGKLGKEEKDAEKSGWIKISHGLSGELYIHKGERDPTQAQVNTLFDWCDKHKAKLPDWAGGK